ncbi:MAG: sulfurtransferase TusA family protein [Alphaproteobacteria bacterium]|nr:sulfurtransferase TusA family protein [Alphaproteobacteria bacterium]
MSVSDQSVVADHRIDITADTCPITFVKTKLKLERMRIGELLEVRLRSGEPLNNVPRSASEEGHAVVSVAAEAADGSIFLVRIRKR